MSPSKVRDRTSYPKARSETKGPGPPGGAQKCVYIYIYIHTYSYSNNTIYSIL